jgi:L-alanine-DL-glutamate epimerase-like enolase superfamily enzyme
LIDKLIKLDLVTKEMEFKCATDLISAFSGKDSQSYQPFFERSKTNKIVDIKIYAVGNNNTNAQFSSKWDVWKQTNIILKLIMADGCEALSGVISYNTGDFSEVCLLELKSLHLELYNLETFDPIEVGMLLRKIKPKLSDLSRSSIDIALWDLAAKRADISLATMLGKKRDSIKSYASLPCYKSLSDYSDAVNKYGELGHKIFKFHVWGNLRKDMALIEMINDEFKESSYHFMVDLESTYTFKDAITLGQLMDEDLFIFIEAPIDDYLLDNYSKIRDLLTIPIVPDGFEFYSSDFIQQGIAKRSWDACKFDATIVGGITEAIKLLIIANNANLPVEFQSWGHSLVQLANLHLTLANKRSQYFEIPMPRELYDFGMKDVILLKDNEIHAPLGPGMGIEVNWSELATADYFKKFSMGVR